MILPKIYDRVASLRSGGYLSGDSSLDRLYLYSLIHSARAVVIRSEYLKNKTLSPLFYQQYFPAYSAAFQEDDCFTKFRMPRQIALDGIADGVGYIGSLKLNTAEFRQVNSRLELRGMQDDRLMKIRSGINYVLFSNGWVEVYGDKIKNFMVEGIWADPTSIPTYNEEIDDYPLEESLITELEKVIMQTDLIIITRSAIDRIADGKDQSSLPMTK